VNCPENFDNRAALVGAEIARIEGHDVDAMRLYEQAIRRLAQTALFIMRHSPMKSLPLLRGAGLREDCPYVFAGRPLWLSALGADGKCGNSNNFIASVASTDRPVELLDDYQ